MGKRSRTKTVRSSAVALAVVCSVAMLAGCASTEPEVGVVDALKARHAAAASITPYRDLTELMGNTTFQTGSKTPTVLTEAVILGNVTDVTEGKAFNVEGNDAPGGTLTDFDDPKAQWRTFHLAVDVAEVISGTAANKITVGLAFGPNIDVESVRADMTSMKDVVLFLERSPVFGYDDAIYGVLSDGALIAQVDNQGTLTLPVLEANESAPMLAGSTTLDNLRQAARGPQVTIHLDATGTERVGQT